MKVRIYAIRRYKDLIINKPLIVNEEMIYYIIKHKDTMTITRQCLGL